MAQGTGVSAQRAVQGETDEALQWPEVLGKVAEGEEVLEVALLWKERPLEVHHFRRGSAPTLGHLPKDSIHLFARSVGGGFALVREEDGGRVLRVPSEARLTLHTASGSLGQQWLEDEGRLRPAASGDAQELDLRPGERAVMALGQLRLAIRQVAAPPRIATLIFGELDFSFIKLAAITGLAAIAFLVALMAPTAEPELYGDLDFRPPAAAPVMTRVLREPPKAPTVELGALTTAPKEPTQTRRPAPRSPMQDRGNTLIAAMKSLSGSASGVFSDTGLGADILSGADKLGAGGEVASIEGMGGVHSRGTGPGPGGGSPYGIGPLGTRRGSPSGHGIELGGPGRGPVVSPGPQRTTIVGGLDKDQIARVIRRHQSEIKYCYEKALTQDPDLAGKVAVLFTIDPAGSIADAQVSESTLGSATAESCIVSRVRRWKFPEPRGGGVVSVNFPWMFKPAGQ